MYNVTVILLVTLKQFVAVARNTVTGEKLSGTYKAKVERAAYLAYELEKALEELKPGM